MAEEGMRKTENNLIHIGQPIAFDMENFIDQLRLLMEHSYANDPKIKELVQKIVSTYHPE